MHVLKALSRHAGIASLMVFQIATVLAIVMNCVFVIGVALSAANERIGIDEDGIGIIQSIGVIGSTGNSTQKNNLAALSRVPGVIHASFGPVPLMGRNHMDISRDSAPRGGVSVVVYRGVEDYQSTLGVSLVEGKGLERSVLPPSTAESPEWPAVIGESLRVRLFGGGPAVGQLMRAGEQRFRVVGVMKDVASALPSQPSDRMTMLIGRHAAAANIGGIYLIRTSPGQVDRVLPAALATMRALNPGHVQSLASTFNDFRRKQTARTNALAYALSVVVAILVVITAFGIGSLTGHWVRQRRTSIGIRRALGARSLDIVSYFLTENVILTTVGVVLGTAGAWLINRVGMTTLDLPPVSPSLVAASVLGVTSISIACAFYPAWRASRVPPAEAVRSL